MVAVRVIIQYLLDLSAFTSVVAELVFPAVRHYCVCRPFHISCNSLYKSMEIGPVRRRVSSHHRLATRCRVFVNENLGNEHSLSSKQGSAFASHGEKSGHSCEAWHRARVLLPSSVGKKCLFPLLPCLEVASI